MVNIVPVKHDPQSLSQKEMTLSVAPNTSALTTTITCILPEKAHQPQTQTNPSMPPKNKPTKEPPINLPANTNPSLNSQISLIHNMVNQTSKSLLNPTTTVLHPVYQSLPSNLVNMCIDLTDYDMTQLPVEGSLLSQGESSQQSLWILNYFLGIYVD